MLASLVAALLTVAPLREAVALASTVEDLKQRLAATQLVEFEEVGGPPGQIHVKLRKPVPARELAAAMKWPRAYIVSTGVHQSSWHVMVWHEDLGDNRFAPVEPTVGSWVFTRVNVDGRPESDALPPLSIPGSPAYDVERYAANVTRFTIEVIDPERHRAAFLLADDLAKLREGIAWHRDMKDPHGPRIDTVAPAVGARVFVDVVIASRPIGELPKLSAGTSVAFDAGRHAADVVAFDINHRVNTR